MPVDKDLRKAKNGFPAQNWNPNVNDYEEAYGSDHAAHVKITDTSGNPIDPRQVIFPDLLNMLLMLSGQPVSNTNRLPVDVGGATFTGTIGDIQAKTSSIVFQNGASAIGAGAPFSVGAYQTLKLEIYGSNISQQTVIFEVQSESGAWYAYPGFKASDVTFPTATQSTGIGEIWHFDIAGLESFRARIANLVGILEVATLQINAGAAASGNVTVSLDGVATNVAVSAGTKEVDTLTLTSGATTAGNITITLNGVATTVAVAAGDTMGAIGDKIRATAFSGWTVGGTAGSATVTFTKNTAGTNTAPTFVDTGSTGTAGSFAVTTAGVNADTAANVASKIAAASFSGWTTSVSGSTVTFTATTDGNKTDATYSAGTTGASGTMTTTVQGASASLSVKGKVVA